MKKTLTLVISFLFISVLNVASANADTSVIATISQLKGAAIIDRKGDRLPASKGMKLLEGDKLYVLEGATANVTYPDAQCATPMSQNMIIDVTAKNLCAKPEALGTGALLVPLVGGLGVTGLVTAVVVVGTVATAVTNVSDNIDNSSNTAVSATP